MTQYLVQSTGTLRYSPKLLGDRSSDKWWFVVDCDPEIGKYYRHLFWLSTHKTYRPWRPAWREHITVIRNEEPPDPSSWEKYAGQTIEFWYNVLPETNGSYWWLNVQCEKLLEIREELGLPRHPTIPLHLSVCHGGNDGNFEHQNPGPG
jgi:hypothetical protein